MGPMFRVMVLIILIGSLGLSGDPAQAQASDSACEKALAKIEDARATDATELDLSGMRLRELPPKSASLLSCAN